MAHLGLSSQTPSLAKKHVFEQSGGNGGRVRDGGGNGDGGGLGGDGGAGGDGGGGGGGGGLGGGGSGDGGGGGGRGARSGGGGGGGGGDGDGGGRRGGVAAARRAGVAAPPPPSKAIAPTMAAPTSTAAKTTMRHAEQRPQLRAVRRSADSESCSRSNCAYRLGVATLAVGAGVPSASSSDTRRSSAASSFASRTSGGGSCIDSSAGFAAGASTIESISREILARRLSSRAQTEEKHPPLQRNRAHPARTKMQIDDTHAFSGPKFIVFPQPKREHIRQTLLAATKVPRYGPDFYNFYGLKWSHEIGGKVYTIEMHQNKEKVWQMRVPCKSNTFLPDPTFETFVVLNSDLYIPYLREPDGAFGEVVTTHAVAHGRGKAQPQASRRAGGACYLEKL